MRPSRRATPPSTTSSAPSGTGPPSTRPRRLLAEIDRLRAEVAESQGEKAKLIRWHGEDEKALDKMRKTIVGLRVELAEANAAAPAVAETGE